MLFTQPLWLLLMVIPLGLAVWYVLVHRVHTVAFSNPEFETDVVPSYRQWPRRTAAALLILAMLGLPLVVARPLTGSTVLENRTTVMVVLDVSTSMTATDVSPSRLGAAQATIAKAVSDAPEELNIGLATLAGDAELVSAPSRDHTALLQAVSGLKPEKGGTATGEGVFVAVNGLNLVQNFGGTADNFKGYIVLISDGKEEIQDGQRNLDAAAAVAKKAGYPVFAVNYGTANGTIDDRPIRSDPASLQAAAKATGGKFYAAGNASELQAALASINSQASSVTVKQPVSEQIAWLAFGLFMALMLAFLFGFIVDKR